MYSGTRHIARQLALAEPIACVDGSHIVDAGDDRALVTRTIHAGAGAALLRLLEEARAATFVFAGDQVFHDRAGTRFVSYVSLWSEQVVELGDVHDPAHFDRQGMCALVSLGSEDGIRDAERAIASAHGGELQTTSFKLRRAGFSSTWGMVVRAFGVTKGTAIEWMAARRGITVSEVVAVGDWLNDIPMLRAAGRSFAMKQAPEEVRAAATDLLDADTWRGGGIAEAARRSGLL